MEIQIQVVANLLESQLVMTQTSASLPSWPKAKIQPNPTHSRVGKISLTHPPKILILLMSALFDFAKTYCLITVSDKKE